MTVDGGEEDGREVGGVLWGSMEGVEGPGVDPEDMVGARLCGSPRPKCFH